jgi:hypothetical protein
MLLNNIIRFPFLKTVSDATANFLQRSRCIEIE